MKTQELLRTTTFSATIGVVAGYGHQNENPENPAQIVGKAWQAIATMYFEETGVYVGAAIADAKTVYHTDWGCPLGGENTALVTGTCNPQYTDVTAYKTAVVEVVRRVAIELGQSTAQVAFQVTKLAYLDFRRSDAE